MSHRAPMYPSSQDDSIPIQGELFGIQTRLKFVIFSRRLPTLPDRKQWVAEWFIGLFLEFDRGTMNRRDYFKKLSAYYDHTTARRFERGFYGYPTILIVTTSNGAEERIAQVARAAAVGHSVSLPLLLTSQWRIDDPTNPHGLLGPIWWEPDVPFDKRYHWLRVSCGQASTPVGITQPLQAGAYSKRGHG